VKNELEWISKEVVMEKSRYCPSISLEGLSKTTETSGLLVSLPKFKLGIFQISK
jgi:hypothetical protein